MEKGKGVRKATDGSGERERLEKSHGLLEEGRTLGKCQSLPVGCQISKVLPNTFREHFLLHNHFLHLVGGMIN